MEKGGAAALPFISTSNVYNIKAMFHAKDIPEDFRTVVLQQNVTKKIIQKIDLKQAWDSTVDGKFDAEAGLSEGTSILLPHRHDVTAVKQARAVLDICLKSVESMNVDLGKGKAKAVASDE